jgi:hypothetical protein
MSQHIGNQGFNGGELQNFKLQNLATDPTPFGKGHQYFNTASNKIRVYNGTAWEDAGGSVDLSDYVKKTGGVTQNVNNPVNFSGSFGSFNIDGDTGTVYTDLSITFDNDVSLLGTTILNTPTAGTNDQQGATTAFVQTEIANKVAGLLDDRGNYDASTNLFPATGGSGSAGAILKGDLWRISVAGTLGGVSVVANDTVRAIVDTPGQTSGNWAILQTEELSAGNGLTRTGNTMAIDSASSAEAKAGSSTAKVVTPSALADFPYKDETLFGNGSLTSFTIAHSRGDRLVICSVFEVATGEEVYPKKVIDATNVVISGWSTAPTTDQYRAVIIG